MGWLAKYNKGDILHLDSYPEGIWAYEKCKIKIIKRSILHRTYTYMYINDPYFDSTDLKVVGWHKLEKLNGRLSLSSALKSL